MKNLFREFVVGENKLSFINESTSELAKARGAPLSKMSELKCST